MNAQHRWIIVVCFLLSLTSTVGSCRFSKSERHGGTLRADIIVSKADLGIPGITKTYEARIQNVGVFPVLIARCDFIDDASTPGTMLAYAIQRWEASSSEWKTVVASSEEFCKPYPLGIMQARLKTRLLWPTKSLSTGEEATAARDVFHIGDRARFVIFTGDAGDFASSVATPSFTIDEERVGPSFPARVRH